MLFHYHFWTPDVEEMERFYQEAGFQTYQRIGKSQGSFQDFSPPLTWEDFRGQAILFRIIEMRKGMINVTFGHGKKIQFDHIGFLVSPPEHDEICDRAKRLGWSVEQNPKRTFLATPYQFEIELQTDRSYVAGDSAAAIRQMTLQLPQEGLLEDLRILFGEEIPGIRLQHGPAAMLTEVEMSGFPSPVEAATLLDPCGVRLSFS